MSQVDYNVANADGATVRADLNAQLDAVATNNSGGSAPSTTFANMWWFDTATNDVLQRNEANTAWVKVANKDPGTGWTPYRQGTALGSAAIAGDASESAKGVVEAATQAETDTGTDDTRFITPLKLETKPAAGFPATTAMLFKQDAAPTGWTKLMTHNDKAIRLTTGLVGTGGSNPFNTVFGSGRTTAAHTLTSGQGPNHAHNIYKKTGDSGSNKGVDTIATDGTSRSPEGDVVIASSGGGGPHSHNMTLDMQYVDFIIATKNA